MKKKKETGCGADLEVAGSAIPAGPEEAGEGSVLCPGLRHVRWFGAEVEPRPRTVRPAPPGAQRSGRVAGAAVELAAVRGGLVAPASSCLLQGAQLGTAVRKAPLPPSQASGSL